MATKRTTVTQTESPTPAERRRVAEETAMRRYPRAHWDPNYYADPRNAAVARSPFGSGWEADGMTTAEWNRQQVAAQASMYGPRTVEALARVLSGAPTVSPGVASSLASLADRLALPQHVEDDILALDAEAQASDAVAQGVRSPGQGSEAEKGGALANIIGTVTRPLFAMLSMPVEAVIGGVRSASREFGEGDFGAGLQALGSGIPGLGAGVALNLEGAQQIAETYSQTLGGQYIAGLADGPGGTSADLGNGFLPNGEVRARQVQAARNAAPLVFGHAWTLGRWVGSMFFDDGDSLAYRNLSGLIDAAANIVLDPTVIFGIGAASARGIRAASSAAGASRVGRETAETLTERQAIEALESAGTVVQRASAVSAETLRVSADFTRRMAEDYAARAGDIINPAVEDLANARDALGQTDELIAAMRGELKSVKGRRRVAEQRVIDQDTMNTVSGEMNAAITDITNRLGQQGVDAMTAKVTADAPDIPGAFTDALFAPGDVRTALPGSDSGLDAIVRYVGDADPRLASVDDAIPQGLPARIGVTVREGGNLGDLINAAAQSGKGQRLLTALRDSDIDAVTDVFRLTGGEGGVWWTTRDLQVARWSEDAVPNSGKVDANGGKWMVVDETPSGVRGRLDQLAARRRTENVLVQQMLRKEGASRRFAESQKEVYLGAVRSHTEVAESEAAIREALSSAMGIRRNLLGKPEVSHDTLKQFLFGPTRDFDSAIGATKEVPTYLRAAEVANRATIGVATLGLSEVARLGRKVVEPFAQRARDALLGAMTRLGDSPENLGLLQRMTNGKVDPSILQAVLRADSEEAVLEVLGPAIGVDITRPLTPSVLNRAPIRVVGMSSGRSGTWLFGRAQRWMTDMAERRGAVVPRFGAHINLADPQGSASVLRNYLNNLPGMSVEQKDRIIGRYLTATTEQGRARQVMRAMDQVTENLTLYNESLKGISSEARELMAQSLKNSTRVFAGGREATNNWWLQKYANDSKIGYVTADGELIQLPGPQLEAELARGGVVLPDITEIRDSIGRWGAFTQRYPALAQARNVLDHGMDYWRSAVLFRLAYTVRNIGEMQFRMFLAGHRSVFNDPLGSLAMASAMNKKTTLSRGLFAKFAQYNKTATGRELGEVGDDSLDALENSLDEFDEIINRPSSAFDARTMRAVQEHFQLTPVRVGQPGFNKGWAAELLKLRSSHLARLAAGWNPKQLEAAIAAGTDRDTAIIAWLMESPAASGIRRLYQESETLAPIWADAAALRQFIFDGPYSIRARIQEYTGSNPDLVGFIATGSLARNGNVVFRGGTKGADPSIRQRAMGGKEAELGKILDTYAGELPEDYILQMRTIRSDRTTPKGVIDNVLDTFFDWNGRKEAAWAMGPEFAYGFNDAVVHLMPAMTKEARQEAFEFIKGAQGRFRFGGETMIQARAAMKAEPGVLTMADVERVAAREAKENVKNLFYDARERRNIFHQLRLVMPFAQPFFDTLWNWGRLAAARPYMMEKLGRFGTALTEPGSGVIYDDFDWVDPFTDRESRDPTQGFIYTDPMSGEQMFTFPLIGSALGAAMSPIAGFNVAESMQLTAPVENLNLAFQGDVDYLPGVGPLISFPMSIMMPDDWYGAAPEWFRKYIFPFGEPNLEGGIVESTLLPSWARRLTGAMYNPEFRAYSWKGLMAYFVSNREYPGLRSDPRVQAQLVDDVQNASHWLTFVRAVGAAVLPAAPSQEIFAADEDGNLIGSMYLADRFNHLRDDAAGDYEAATQAFIDTFGMQAIAAILPTSEGDTSMTGPAWEFFKKNPSDAEGYTDVLGDFFPGDFSYEAMSWQQNAGSRRRLTVEERSDQLISYLYQAEKRQIEGRAAQDGWDIDQIDQAEEDLDQSYSGVTPTFSGLTPEDRLDRYRRAIDTFPELAATRGGRGAAELFEAYDEYTEIAQRRYGVGLRGQEADGLRNEFLDEVDRIVAEYGGMNEADGSVTTIARRFAAAVEPRS